MPNTSAGLIPFSLINIDVRFDRKVTASILRG